MATQTEVLRQILQVQQQIAQQMNRGPPHGANHEGPNQVTVGVLDRQPTKGSTQSR
jgi:hypothetical protein